MGKEDEHVFDSMLPDAVTFDDMNWLVWFCTTARIWGRESPSAREKPWERSWAVSTKDGDVVTGAEETTEFATEEEPKEEVSDESNMAAALLVDCPKCWFIKKQAKEAVQTCEETVMICLKRTAWALSCHTTKRQRTPPVRTPRFDPQAHGIPTHAHMCRHRWPPGERKHSLLLTPLNYIFNCIKSCPLEHVMNCTLNTDMNRHSVLCYSYWAWTRIRISRNNGWWLQWRWCAWHGWGKWTLFW